MYCTGVFPMRKVTIAMIYNRHQNTVNINKVIFICLLRIRRYICIKSRWADISKVMPYPRQKFSISKFYQCSFLFIFFFLKCYFKFNYYEILKSHIMVQKYDIDHAWPYHSAVRNNIINTGEALCVFPLCPLLSHHSMVSAPLFFLSFPFVS